MPLSIGVFRLVLIIASFTFALYLVPGLSYAPLTRIPALLPSQGDIRLQPAQQGYKREQGAAPGTLTPGTAGKCRICHLRYTKIF
ncbi:MAG: hypothetical protein R2756_10780 [Bacteroidales bacterium]